MSVFSTPAHLVSWAKWSPQVKQSAGKRKGSNATGRGNPYLGAALGEAAISNLKRESEGTLLKCVTPFESVNAKMSARANPGKTMTASKHK